MSKVGFPVGLADDLLKEKVVDRRRIDWDNEIVDMDEGWVYARKGNRKGKRLRKYFQKLDVYDGNGATFWKPKINDLLTAEAKRWKALEYKQRQLTPLLKVFDLVRDNVPFCCIRITDNWPEYSWVKFPRIEPSHGIVGVSWNWFNGRDKPKGVPLKQDVGDAWFFYEDRSRDVRRRVGYFESVFLMALEKRYSHEYYKLRHRGQFLRNLIINGRRHRGQFLRNLIINGRPYLVGDKNGGGHFGVIAYPEEIVTEIVE